MSDKRSWHPVAFGWRLAESTVAHAYILPAIKYLLPEGPRLTILDVGCGNGYIASRLSAMGHTVIGIDSSEDGINIARKAHPDVRFELYSAYDDLRAITEAVDVVVSSEVIEHLFRPQLFLRNAFLILRPGGSVILTTPYHGYLKNVALSLFDKWDKHFSVDHEGGHIKFFSEKTLARMLNDCGFENVMFHNAGRVRWLWKSMVCRAQRPAVTWEKGEQPSLEPTA
jgi:2-polyprenyl-3-methyl-5-hydroxy-6-metoxy-1,4-benzoquinol methylase